MKIEYRTVDQKESGKFYVTRESGSGWDMDMAKHFRIPVTKLLDINPRNMREIDQAAETLTDGQAIEITLTR